ncbi:Uncharacterised protein [Vibrio cholerae]|nr:Uncharacterised protein [Vibrio cholerae]
MRISLPSNFALPVILPFLASSPMMANTVCDFPEPDSPTIPKVSPCLREKLRSFTAVTIPSWVENSTRRSLTSNKLIIASFLFFLVYLSFGSSASRRPSPT